MEAMGTLMRPGEKDPRRVNVLGRSPDEDHIPMPPLLPALEGAGLRLRYLAPEASVEDFQNAPDAALNLVVSPYAGPLAQRMERDFGIPHAALHTLFAGAEIDLAYREIGAGFGLTWRGQLDGERERALVLEEKAAGRLKGLRYVCSPGAGMPLALAAYLAGFGMEPLLLHMDEFYPEDQGHAKALLARGQNPPICRMVNMVGEYPILAKLAPDLCFGRLPLGKQALPNVENMHRLYGKIGYELTAELLEQTLAGLDKAAGKAGGVSGPAGKAAGKVRAEETSGPSDAADKASGPRGQADKAAGGRKGGEAYGTASV
jgi:hypothetical protein